MYVLSELFGNCPQVKIVETFAENYDDTLSVPDIMQMIDVSKATIYSHIEQLLKEDIIKKARKVGKTQLYQLNNNNPKAKIILMLERFIVAERLEKMVEKEPTVVVSEFIGVQGITQSAGIRIARLLARMLRVRLVSKSVFLAPGSSDASRTSRNATVTW